MASKADEPKQRCCLGLLYYSQALEAEGRKPVCVGLPHTPNEHLQLEDNKLLREQHGFKFMCLGHSLYELPQQSSRGGTSSHVQTLPYCEGLEVIVAANAEATAAAGTSGRQQEEWSTVLSSMLGGEESPIVKGVSRFNKTAQRNWDRMKSSVNQAYSTTLKPLVDKLSGDQA